MNKDFMRNFFRGRDGRLFPSIHPSVIPLGHTSNLDSRVKAVLEHKSLEVPMDLWYLDNIV